METKPVINKDIPYIDMVIMLADCNAKNIILEERIRRLEQRLEVFEMVEWNIEKKKQ